ncbi:MULTISPECIES: helix-turn-helix transcriptional regulator [unclassified Streptomyces]|uniref:helix-turn-helix transcriptional regulator n=1 Tax=unclassified Streptomyces TaxID=2593676 RepID=UPI000DDA5009|nr:MULTISPECIES: helix-turn-helix transcriptional regulator [unclassified Streptomyces]QZZ29210.1 helix-turn-helix transcriptional regulator [Streptomyces sp. ST1015]
MEAHRHSTEEVCEEGLALYARALSGHRIPAAEAEPLPCLTTTGLLLPSLDVPGTLRPLPPALALPRLLRTIAQEIAERRQCETRLAESFVPLLALAEHEHRHRHSHSHSATEQPPGFVLLDSLDRIDDAIRQAMLASSEEILTVQPGGKRPVSSLALALPKEQEMLSRGGRMRTLYQHTSRHDPAVLAHYEFLAGDVEVRTLDEVPDRLIVLDRAVAFIPANPERTAAVEIRHRPTVAHLATTFDRLWRLATPMYPEAAQQLSSDGVTPRQRAIAALLIEGHTDAVIADRLGLNIRTAREHIAKLAAALGSDSRAQLGYLIAESGILKQKEAEE